MFREIMLSLLFFTLCGAAPSFAVDPQSAVGLRMVMHDLDYCRQLLDECNGLIDQYVDGPWYARFGLRKKFHDHMEMLKSAYHRASVDFEPYRPMHQPIVEEVRQLFTRQGLDDIDLTLRAAKKGIL